MRTSRTACHKEAKRTVKPSSFLLFCPPAEKEEKDGKKVLTNEEEGGIVSKLSVTQRRDFRKSVVVRKKYLTKRMSGGKI